MWYHAADPTPEDRKHSHRCLAESVDGIHWDKPVAALAPMADSTSRLSVARLQQTIEYRRTQPRTQADASGGPAAHSTFSLCREP